MDAWFSTAALTGAGPASGVQGFLATTRNSSLESFRSSVGPLAMIAFLQALLALIFMVQETKVLENRGHGV